MKQIGLLFTLTSGHTVADPVTRERQSFFVFFQISLNCDFSNILKIKFYNNNPSRYSSYFVIPYLSQTFAIITKYT